MGRPKKKVGRPEKKNEFKLYVDTAKDVARLGALCVPVFNALLLFLLYHCAALPLRPIALHLHWIGHRQYTISEKNTTLEIKTNKRANCIHQPHLLLSVHSSSSSSFTTATPLPPSIHSQFRPPCHSHDGTAGLVVV